jgi:hypothetical protein
MTREKRLHTRRKEPGVTVSEATPPRQLRRRQASADDPNRLVKASFNIPAEELDALKELAERRQTSATQVLREALRTERYMQGLLDSGATIIARVGRRSREIVFSHMT